MAYIFEEYNFKSHLHRNCKRKWFDNASYNVMYKDENGTHHANTSERATVGVGWAIKDPVLNKDKVISGTRAVVGSTGFIVFGG